MQVDQTQVWDMQAASNYASLATSCPTDNGWTHH